MLRFGFLRRAWRRLGFHSPVELLQFLVRRFAVRKFSASSSASKAWMRSAGGVAVGGNCWRKNGKLAAG